MIEIKHVRQIDGEPQRRWFTSVDLDLMLWLDQDENLLSWQFCYDKARDEHAVGWHFATGWHHQKVDDGEPATGLSYKSSPLLREDQDFAPVQQRVLALFVSNASALPTDYAEQIQAKLAAWPNID